MPGSVKRKDLSFRASHRGADLQEVPKYRTTTLLQPLLTQGSKQRWAKALVRGWNGERTEEPPLGRAGPGGLANGGANGGPRAPPPDLFFCALAPPSHPPAPRSHQPLVPITLNESQLIQAESYILKGERAKRGERGREGRGGWKPGKSS